MAEKVLTLGIKKAKHFLYFLDSDGDISRKAHVPPFSANPGPYPPAEKVKKLAFRKHPQYLYHVDSDGDLAKTQRMPPRRY
jgi:hypothetical protein